LSETIVEDTAQAVDYPAAFFERYQPNTALDMVNQIPGFQLDDGRSTRGFASSVGNILINDRRPSAKQDLLSEILVRIPASQVERIELIRTQVRDIDLQGQAVVANVILQDIDRAAVRWRGSLRYNFEYGITAEAGISASDRWRDIDYNTGIQLRRYTRGDFTRVSVQDGNAEPTETRIDEGDFLGLRGSANLSAAKFIGETFVRFNTKIFGDVRDGERISNRTPLASGSLPNQQTFVEDFEIRDIEIGIDAERSLRPELVGKGILLYFDSVENLISSQLSLDNNGVVTRERISDNETRSSETIARVEFIWTGWAGHAIQANLEGAFNSLDNTLAQTVDIGTGPEIVDVPGGDSRVEEVRADLLLKDTWSLGRFELEYGLGAEVSTISQTGDAELERDFTFLKPQIALTFAPNEGTQTRVRLGREISQLDFNDFVSATVFEDDDLALGNPDLRPETTWRLEVGYERRFGRDSVVKLSAFHDWISDVEDLLPLTESFEAPGNIGDGQRWGLELETTLPLDRLRIKGGKLDIQARWQDSSVVDPVTGTDRVLSVRTSVARLLPLVYRIENEYAFIVEFRQDFETTQWAWGWDVRERAERLFYKVNELEIGDEGTEFNLFVETTRWLGLKARFAVENILDVAQTRDRTFFAGGRDLSPVDGREFQHRVRALRLNLTVSGNF